MRAKPVGKSDLVTVASGDLEHQGDHFRFIRHDAKAIEPEKDLHGLERHPLAAVDERVVPGDSEPVRSRQRGEIGRGVVVPPVSRPFEGRLQEPLVSDARGASMLADLFGMDSLRDRTPNPPRLNSLLVHLASSRMAFRYWRAPSA